MKVGFKVVCNRCESENISIAQIREVDNILPTKIKIFIECTSCKNKSLMAEVKAPYKEWRNYPEEVK